MNPIVFSQRVTAVVWSDKTTGFAPSDWVELALASLDQAGLSARDQDRIRRMLHAMIADSARCHEELLADLPVLLRPAVQHLWDLGRKHQRVWMCRARS